MKKEEAQEAVKKVKENSNKRNFKQTVDLIITLKDLDLKKPESQINLFFTLHYNNGKEAKVCGLVGPELFDQAKKELDFAIDVDSFEDYAKDKKKVKKLADEYDYFVAQANLMAKVASTFGRVLGPKNKMPNPKAGCVVPANANIASLKERLQKTVRIQVKNELQYQAAVGKEDQDDKEIVDNMMTIYNQIVHHLPLEDNNINNIYLKLTMGKLVKIK